MGRQKKGKVTQKEMVQTALNEKGWEAPSADMQAFIKEKFGTELSANVISNYKSVIKRGGGKGGKGKRGRKPGATLQVAHLQKVRELVSELGAAQVKQLVDVLA